MTISRLFEFLDTSGYGKYIGLRNLMHDLLAAKEILNIVKGEAQKNNFKKITKIVIELGYKFVGTGRDLSLQKSSEHFEEINPENLEYNLKIISKNTLADNAEIVIEKSTNPDIVVKEIEGE